MPQPTRGRIRPPWERARKNSRHDDNENADHDSPPFLGLVTFERHAATLGSKRQGIVTLRQKPRGWPTEAILPHGLTYRVTSATAAAEIAAAAATLAMAMARFALQFASFAASTAAHAASLALRTISSSPACASFLRPSFFSSR